MPLRSRSKSPILLDWVNIRYRTVYLTVGLLLVVGATAGGTWYHWKHRDPMKIDARNAIDIATTAVLQAASQDLSADYLPPLVERARSSLDRAELSYDSADYTDAIAQAAQARQSALAVLQATRSGGDQEVRFYRLEGDVKVKRVKRFDWEEATTETILRPGDQVKTSSSGSAQIIYFDGAITTIKPGSLLEIKHLYQNPTTRVQKVEEKLNWGSVSASTQPASVPGSVHEVATDTSVARSTEQAEFEVRYDRERRVASVDLYRGALQVAPEGQASQPVSAGERVDVGDGRILGKTTLLPAPELVAPGDQWAFNNPEPETAVTTLSWDEVAGAHQYHVQISEGSLFSRNVYERTDLQGATADVEGLMPGSYFWRVAARSPQGIASGWSEVRKFRVISKQMGPTQDLVPPELKLEEFIQAGPMIILAGMTEPGAQLWVTSHGTTKRVDVDPGGRFTTVVKLTREGKNRVQIRSQDAAGNESVVSRTATVYSY